MIKTSEFSDKGALISLYDGFNIELSCECGQCFRFTPSGNGYEGIAQGTVFHLEQIDSNTVFFKDITREDFEKTARRYFDLDRDYNEANEYLCKDSIIKKAYESAKGIRIFNQNPFEALISFIISQNNNIPRIRGIIERLCEAFGTEISKGKYSFPNADSMRDISEENLSVLRAGFRSKYIIDAVGKVLSGEIRPEMLESLPYEDAFNMLLKIRGVGPKVANCVLLFGAGHMEAFPVDVWIGRALKAFYGDGPVPDFGRFGGLAQQYLFVYARENKLI